MMTKWMATVFCWDGVLPLLSVFTPWLVKWNFPQGHIAEVVAVVLVPIAMALLRATFAHRTLSSYYEHSLPILRQLGLGLAIISLLLLEVVTSLLIFAPEAPILPGVLLGWLVYIALMLIATFPPRRVQHGGHSSGQQWRAPERRIGAEL